MQRFASMAKSVVRMCALTNSVYLMRIYRSNTFWSLTKIE